MRKMFRHSAGCAATTEGRDERRGDGSLGAVRDRTKQRSCDRE